MLETLRRAVRRGLYRLKGFPLYSLLDQLQESQYWTRAELTEFQNQKLRRLMQHVYMHVPYYRRVMDELNLVPEDFRETGDLQKLPVLTRQELRKNSAKLRSSAPPSGKPAVYKTGGTTGEPLEIWKDLEAVVWGNAAYYRGLGWAGYNFDRDRLALLFGGSLKAKRSVLRTRGFTAGLNLSLSAFDITSDSLSEYYDRLRRFRPHFLKGYAGAVYLLAMKCLEANYNELNFEAAFTTSEQLPVSQRNIIESAFGCEVFDYYGCVEINSLGYECEFHQGYHIPEEHAVVEVVPEANVGVESHGCGALLLTDLDNYQMPLIRYKNGDAGTVLDEPCACGRKLRRIAPLMGRVADLLLRTDGTPVLGGIATYVFRETRLIREFCLIQEELRRCRLQYVSDDSDDEVADAIVVLKRFLGADMEFITERLDHIPRIAGGKRRVTMSKIAHEQTLK